MSSPSGVWGRAPAASDFKAFQIETEAFGAIIICHNSVAKKSRLDANSSLLSILSNSVQNAMSSSIYWGLGWSPSSQRFWCLFRSYRKVLVPLQSIISCCIGIARKLSLVEIPILNYYSTFNSMEIVVRS